MLHDAFDYQVPPTHLYDEKHDHEKTPKNQSSFISAFLKDPYVGSVASSSDTLCKAVVSFIEDRGQSVVELGAGTGVITERLLETLHWSASVYALETNKGLLDGLLARCGENRLVALNQSAEELETICVSHNVQPKYIVSGVPFRLMKPSSVRSIIEQCRTVLDPQGKLILYQAWVPGAGIYRVLEEALSKHFTVEHKEVVLWNVPPLYVLVCKPRDLL